MKVKLETMKFEDGLLADLIWHLWVEAVKWCEGHCLCCRDCFNDERGTFHPEQIEECGKIPRLYKLYWRAKGKNISALAPLIVKKEEENARSENLT